MATASGGGGLHAWILGEYMNGLMYLGVPFSASVSGTVIKVKDAAGQVFGYNILNNSGVIAYAQMFDRKATGVVIGTTVPDYVIPLPGNGVVGRAMERTGTPNGTGV